MVKARAPHAERVKHAGIVVQFANGEVVNQCVEFNEGSLSGLELLERASECALETHASRLRLVIRYRAIGDLRER